MGLGGQTLHSGALHMLDVRALVATGTKRTQGVGVSVQGLRVSTELP